MPTFSFWRFFSSLENRLAEGGVRSGFHGNCQPPIPPPSEHALSSPWQRRGPVSQGTRGVMEGMRLGEKEGGGRQV